MTRTPKSLFKYLGPDRVDLLQNLEIAFTPPGNFNDPFEMSPRISGLEDCIMIEKFTEQHFRVEYRRFCQNPLNPTVDFALFKNFLLNGKPFEKEELRDQVSKFQSGMGKAYEKLFDLHLGVLCLSEMENEPLMWSHYTDCHKGFVVEFDTAHPFFNRLITPTADFGKLLQIIYSPKRPELAYPVTTKDTQIFLTKSHHWAYEREWRLIQLLEKSDRKLQKGAQTIHLYKIPPKAIRRIVMGCKMEEPIREKIVSALRSNPDSVHIVLEEAVKDTDAFALRYLPAFSANRRSRLLFNFNYHLFI